MLYNSIYSSELQNQKVRKITQLFSVGLTNPLIALVHETDGLRISKYSVLYIMIN